MQNIDQQFGNLLKEKKGHLEDFYHSSVMFQRFTFVQSLCLCWIFINKSKATSKYICLFIVSVFKLYENKLIGD